MNYLIYSKCICSPMNYAIAVLVKVLLFIISWIIPILLILHGIIKILDKKSKDSKKQKIIQLVKKIIGAILLFGFGFVINLILGLRSDVTITTENHTWIDCYYSEICQPE